MAVATDHHQPARVISRYRHTAVHNFEESIFRLMNRHANPFPNPHSGASATSAESLTAVVWRLHQDFHAHASLVDVVLTVCLCRRELDIVADASRPEMIERLARQRLTARRPSG
jgi:hypothetical protein